VKIGLFYKTNNVSFMYSWLIHDVKRKIAAIRAIWSLSSLLFG